ncbi:MAG: recombinase family protein [Clostridia bacterium]|nr:recombinase family protein [Clostridia bacterium]
MKKDKIKVYIYTRVSTTVQVDGYSLDAQKARMKAFAEFNDYEIVGEYEDAGKSGKSIEGRLEFNSMMEDIKSGKDGVSYVLVFKLSRFGRNAADVLSTLQVMQDFGVNLICVEDGIDSSKDAGKLMISVLSAVAEIERENIRVQTMEGRIQKAREGKWNGGFAPYGYTLEKGNLFVNEEEAEAIRIIFDKYVHTDMGANGLARYLANHGIGKIQRQNGKNPLFDAALIRRILKNPVYCGKIAYGRRRTEKVHGTRNDYRLVEQDDYLLVDGLHEALVSEELWHEAQVKLLAQAKKYEKVNRGKDNKVHLLTGLLKCPICGAGMYGNKSVKHKPDGTKYKDFYYYGCKHRTMTRGHKCDYKKQIHEELLETAVAEVITKLVSNPRFASLMQQKISMKVDTAAIEQEIANYEKQLRQCYSIKSRLFEEIDTLDPDDKHYIKRKADLDDRLYKMYDKIEDTESLLIEARAKKTVIEAEKLTADNIYKVLIYFDRLYAVMDDAERRQLMESLISEIHIFEERKPNGQWLKSIKFKLPIIEEDMKIGLDNDTHIESVVRLTRRDSN